MEFNKPDPKWRPTEAELDEMQTRYENRLKNAEVGEYGRFGRVIYRFNNLTIEVPPESTETRESIQKRFDEASTPPYKDITDEKV